MNDFAGALSKLRAYVESEGFKGYDPYDALNAKIDFSLLGKWGPILAIQLQKRNPLNIRPLLGIKKGYNPKGMGLLLRAYSTLYELEPTEETKQTAVLLFDWLCSNYSKGYSGYCWGYNFAWANPNKYLETYSPSSVVTCTVAQGIFKYFQVTNDTKALEVLKSVCEFLLNDLHITETEDGICFSYTTLKRNCCYNASMLVAETLAKVGAVTGDKDMQKYATRAVDFALARQFDDGRWNYSMNLDSGEEREQIDFHQGFMLDSLYAYITYTSNAAPKYREALERGAEFYWREQFFESGRSLWRLPKKWPVDIHNQSQGIITFARLAEIDSSYLDLSKTIAWWTIGQMQDEKGYFYYRKHRYFTNKIPYMRWSQAWMMLALSELLQRLQFEHARRREAQPEVEG